MSCLALSFARNEKDITTYSRAFFKRLSVAITIENVQEKVDLSEEELITAITPNFGFDLGGP